MTLVNVSFFRGREAGVDEDLIKNMIIRTLWISEDFHPRNDDSANLEDLEEEIKRRIEDPGKFQQVEVKIKIIQDWIKWSFNPNLVIDDPKKSLFRGRVLSDDGRSFQLEVLIKDVEENPGARD